MAALKIKEITMTDDSVTEYKETLKKRAENLLLTEFPVKIVKLNQLLEKFNFQNVNLGSIHQDLNIPVPKLEEPRAAKRRRTVESSIMTATAEGPKVYTLPNGPSPCNNALGELIRTTKPYLRQLVEDVSTLKMWVAYMIPKIEDGNNFGVEIQEATFLAIDQAESNAEEYLNQISEYFVNRAKIISKVAKYPHIEDYRRAVRERDETQYLTLCFNMRRVRNNYCMLHDVLTKNLERIKKPRTSHVESLY